jgi:hypothetical protein
LPLIADIVQYSRHVSKVPIADVLDPIRRVRRYPSGTPDQHALNDAFASTRRVGVELLRTLKKSETAAKGYKAAR